MHTKYVAMTFDARSGGGDWRIGDTLEEVSKIKRRGRKATSDLPFAPRDRSANDDEADVWVDRYGTINSIGCELQEVA